MGSIPGSGISLEGGYGNPLQYSCSGNPINGGVWKATVQRVTRSQTPLNTHAHTPHPGILTTPTRGALSSVLNQMGTTLSSPIMLMSRRGEGVLGGREEEERRGLLLSQKHNGMKTQGNKLKNVIIIILLLMTLFKIKRNCSQSKYSTASERTTIKIFLQMGV